MPYKSLAQEKYFNANRKTLEKQGVNVNEWNKSSKGLKLPEHIVKKLSNKKFKGKGGLMESSYKQASSPINLLRTVGEPPVANKIPNTVDNYSGNKLTK